MNFAGEPILRVTAPIIEAQLVETFLLSVISYQTTVATKASRVVRAASYGGVERVVSDFGLRRAHGRRRASARRARLHRRLRGHVQRLRRAALPHSSPRHCLALMDYGIRHGDRIVPEYRTTVFRHDIPAHRHVRPEERRAERGNNGAVAQGRAHRQRRPRAAGKMVRAILDTPG